MIILDDDDGDVKTKEWIRRGVARQFGLKKKNQKPLPS